MLFRPSFFSFIVNGLLILVFLILFYNTYPDISNRDLMYYALLASIAFGIHSMLHYREEKIDK